MSSFFAGPTAIAFATGMQGVFALAPLPFMEDFVSNNSNWSTSNSSISANWFGNGGVDDGGFISANGTVTLAGFGFITFRGNDGNNASGDAFVGNWLTAGVSTFSAYVRHNAPMNLNIYARLDAGGGRAGSSVDFSVDPNTWTQLVVPILDSPSSFQSYGSGNFTSVFSGIQNIQIAMSFTQNGTLNGQVVTLGLDKVSIVPEPGTIGLAGGAGVLLLGLKAWRRRKK